MEVIKEIQPLVPVYQDFLDSCPNRTNNTGKC